MREGSSLFGRICDALMGLTGPKIGYMGFVGAGNIGDDLLEASIRRLLRRAAPRPFRFRSAWRHSEKQQFDLFVCGGGTLISNYYTAWMKQLEFVMDRGVPLVIFGTGFLDDGLFAEREDLDYRPDVVLRISEQAKLIGVRGPESKRHFEAAGAPAAKIRVIGDPALDYDPPLSSALADDGVSRVGISVGYSPYGVFGGEGHMKALTAGLCGYLRGKVDEVVLFGMRDKDLPILREIHASPHAGGARLVDRVMQVDEAFQLIHGLSLLVSGKLHPGVMATAIGVPFLSFAYEPKCLDFARSIGQERFLARTDASPGELIGCFEAAWEQRASIRAALIERRNAYRSFLRDFAVETARLLE